MRPMTLGQIGQAIGADVAEHAAQRVACGVSTDSRAVVPGQVFVALQGDRFDGTRFLEAAFAQGALAAIVPEDTDVECEGVLLRVPCTRRALLDFARCYRRLLGFTVVAITGSAGKTTTKDLCFHLLGDPARCVKAEKSFNNEIGVPLTLLAADASTRVVVVEIGTNAPGEIATLAAVAEPDVAVITCIGASHLEGLGSVEGVAREKLSLLDYVRPGGRVILNGDDPRLAAAAARLRAAGREVEVCTLRPTRGSTHPAEWRAQIIGRGARWRAQLEAPVEATLDLPLPGEHVATDALLALAVATRLAPRLGADFARAATRLGSFGGSPGRLELRKVAGRTVIDDTYNANPESVRASLDVLAELAPAGQRVAVLGAMLELGEASEALHAEVGAHAAGAGLGALIVVGAEALALAEGARRAGLEQVFVVDEPDQAAALARDLAPEGAALLFKASRGQRLERAVEAFVSLLDRRACAAAA